MVKSISKKTAIITGSSLGGIIVVIIIIISLSGIGVFSGGDEYRELIIKVNSNDIRNEDIFNLTIENLPSGANVTWDLGDGNFTYNSSVMHSYPFSNYYLVKAEAKWKGGHGNGSILLCVKNPDGQVTRNGGAIRKIRRGGGPIGAQYFFICGISNPTFDVTININGMMGSYEIFISYINGTEWEYAPVREFHRTVYSVVTYQESFSDLVFENVGGENWFFAGFYLLEGRCSSWDSTIIVTY